ncbi:hypothetical protein KM043_003780 [Ampulex compressa]|nr:hypothetical protein KM043_003780 [Ampulex compressa]
MKIHRPSVLFVLLVFYASLNQGQKVKVNDRRASGLVPYPRIGRNSEVQNFPRADRAAGLVHYPRVGRSDLPNGFNRYQDMESDVDFELYAGQDIDQDLQLDTDYEGHAASPLSLARLDKISRDGVWLMPDHPHVAKQIPPPQKTDDIRPFFAGLRGLRNNQGTATINDYTPRLGRETDRDSTSFL